jgi:beta-glucanase (GH16 family)
MVLYRFHPDVLLRSALAAVALFLSVPLFAENPAPSPSFSDEFDGGMVDSIWSKAHGWTNGGIFDCGWLADSVAFSDGIMRITLNKIPASGKPYASGEYRSKGFYSYGRYEVRMKAAKGVGTVTSFFTYTGPSDNQPWDEIDFEILGKDTTKVQINYFVAGTGGHEKLIELGFDASADFHVYAFVWAPDSIEWYVDGTSINKIKAKKLPSHNQRIMMNLWPGSSSNTWTGAYAFNGPLVAEYDWVRYTAAE